MKMLLGFVVVSSSAIAAAPLCRPAVLLGLPEQAGVQRVDAKCLGVGAMGPECAGLISADGTFVLEPAANSLELFGMGIASPALAQVRQAVSRGRSAAGAATMRYNAVTYVGCGVHFPVLINNEKPISGFYVDRQRNWLVAVHVGQRRYSGAVVPYYLEESTLSLLNLKTFELRQVELDSLGFGFQSVAVGFLSEGRLAIRLKDVWNTGGDKRKYFECSLESKNCTPTPTLSPGAFPQADVLEVIASSAYILTSWPPGFAAPAGLMKRSVRMSPNGRAVAWVTEVQPSRKDESPRRALFVAAVGGKPQKVAEGTGWFHALWVDDDRLRFDADPVSSPRLAKVREQIKKSEAGRELMSQYAGMGKEDAALTQGMIEAQLTQLVAGEIEAGKVAGMTLRDLQEERVVEYRVSTKKSAPWGDSIHMRLFSEYQFPNVRGTGVIDVDPD